MPRLSGIEWLDADRARRRRRSRAILHDIGKIGIPDRILLKQRPLDAEETALMRTHTEIGRGC